jgi:hypothetical protein
MGSICWRTVVFVFFVMPVAMSRASPLLRAAEATFELIAGSELGESFRGGGQHRVAELQGTFRLVFTQSSTTVFGSIRDLDFRGVSTSDRVTGRGQYAFEIVPELNGTFIEVTVIDLEATVNGLDNIFFTSELSFAKARFPHIVGIVSSLKGSASLSIRIVARPAADHVDRFFRRGDANRDGRINVADVSIVLLALFSGDNRRLCPDAADVDDDGNVSVNDAVLLLRFLFLAGEFPRAPALFCGVDTTEDNLECASFLACP